MVSLYGLVLASGDNSPIPYALVQVEGSNNLRTRANDEGEFKLELPGHGIYQLKTSINNTLNGMSDTFTVDSEQINSPLILYIELNAFAEEIVVSARSPTTQPSETRIGEHELKHVAGTGGDALIVVQSFPGVAIGEDTAAAPAVRGSFPGDNLYVLDYLPIGYLFHITDAISVIPRDLIQEIDFYPSAFGPEFGDKTGAVFDIKLIEPDTTKWVRSIDLSLLGASVSAQGPMTKGQSAFVSFRRSYLDLLIKAIDYNERNREKITEEPKYVDYQGKYLWHLSQNNRLTFSLNGSNDSSTIERFPGGITWIADNKIAYQTQAVVWDYYRGVHSNKLALGYLYNMQREIDGPFYEEDIVARTLFVKERLQTRLIKNHHQLIGGELYSQQRDYAQTVQIRCEDSEGCSSTVSSNLRINRGVAYIKDRWFPNDKIGVDIGARLSGNDLVRTFYLEPRIGFDWDILSHTRFTAAWGRYNQIPGAQHLLGNAANPNLEHTRSTHSVLGISQEFANGWSAKTETFYKTSWDLLEWDSDKQHYINNGTGKAYGVELMIKKALIDRYSGWLSLTGSHTEISNHLRGETLRTYYDQPIIATFVFNAKILNQWYFDLKWYYHTGRPYTPVTGADPIIDGETGEIRFYRPQTGASNSRRYPAYHRLDVRLSKQMNFTWLELETYVGVINLYNRENVNEYNYAFDYSSKSPAFQLPRFVTFGITATF